MIYLLRHGDAEDGEGMPDAERRLTEKGKRQSAAAGRALARLGPAIETCLTSPKVRAEQTARIASEPLGLEVEVVEALRGGAFDAAALTAGRGDSLLVGHEPDLTDEVARVTGARARLKKGGVAVIDGSTLMALLRPKELRAIADSRCGR